MASARIGEFSERLNMKSGDANTVKSLLALAGHNL